MDKVSITAPVNKDDEEAVKQAFHVFAKTGDGVASVSNGGKPYRINMRIWNNEKTQSALVQADPKNPKNSFLRVEFNPEKLGKDGLLRLKSDLSTCTPLGWEHFLLGRVTRIDAALDVEGASLAALHVMSKHAVMATSFKRSGKLQCLYLGAPNSAKRVRIYDKKAQLNLLKSAQAITRFEPIIKGGFPLNAIAALSNPFESVKVLEHPLDDAVLDHPLGQLFAAAVREMQLASAVCMLPKDLRGVFRDLLKDKAAAWWSPEEFWKEWPKVVANSGLLSD